MGSSWTKEEWVTSSNSSSLTSLQPSEPDVRGVFIPPQKTKLNEKLPTVPFTQEVRSVYHNSCGMTRNSENQRSLFTEWRRLLQPAQVHPERARTCPPAVRRVRHNSESSWPSHVPVTIASQKNDLETESPMKNIGSSLPMKCPPRRTVDGALQVAESLCHSGSAEYLRKLYEVRTWNMYNLIMESRRQNGAAQPRPSTTVSDFNKAHRCIEMDCGTHDESSSHATTDDPEINGSDSDINNHHPMVFPLDDH